MPNAAVMQCTYHLCPSPSVPPAGLGKTLQGITLLWTLLQNGHEALGGAPLAKRAIICCPTSLVANWDSECSKWLCGRVSGARNLSLACERRLDAI